MEKNILIDFHAHILPDMDHGCDGVAMSLEQLNMAAEQQIDVIIATSPFYPHIENVTDFLRRRKVAWDKLSAARVKEYHIIKLGAEVLICNRIDKMEGIEDLCIENSKVLLIEMPFKRHWDNNLIETAVRLREDKGLNVIIAHGERYPRKEMDKLLEKEFQIQLNVSSTANFILSSFVKKCIKEHYVVAFGSDIHGLSNSYKDFTRSMKRLGDKAEEIMEKTRKLVSEKS